MAKSNLHKYTPQEAGNILVAAGGADIVVDDTVSDHTYVAITSVGALGSGNTPIQAISADTDIWDDIGDLRDGGTNGVSIPAGVTIYGRWTTVKVLSVTTAYVHRAFSTD